MKDKPFDWSVYRRTEDDVIKEQCAHINGKPVNFAVDFPWLDKFLGEKNTVMEEAADHFEKKGEK